MSILVPASVRRWLLADSPQSDIQARCGRFYLNAVALARNPLTMMGIVLVAALFAVALFCRRGESICWGQIIWAAIFTAD